MIKVSIIMPAYNQEELILRGLESIPARKDLETIIINDGSSDNTLTTIINYIKEHPEKNIRYHSFETNQGVSAACNWGYDNAIGEYVVLLASDGDYLCHPGFEKAIKQLDGTDMVYFDMRVNNGDIWQLNENSKWILCGSTKFIRREFLGDERCPLGVQYAEDYDLFTRLQKKNPTEKFTRLLVKHYNHPRKGSLVWLGEHQNER